MAHRSVERPAFRQSDVPQQVVGKIGGPVPNCAAATRKKRIERVESVGAVAKDICHISALNPQLCGRGHAGIL